MRCQVAKEVVLSASHASMRGKEANRCKGTKVGGVKTKSYKHEVESVRRRCQ